MKTGLEVICSKPVQKSDIASKLDIVSKKIVVLAESHRNADGNNTVGFSDGMFFHLMSLREELYGIRDDLSRLIQ